MAFLKPAERRFVQSLSRLAHCNPFLPERIDLEKQVLGSEFVGTDRVWSLRPDRKQERENIRRLTETVEPLADRLRQRLAEGTRGTETDILLYEDLVLYLLYYRYWSHLHETVTDALSRKGPPRRIGYWQRFAADIHHYLAFPDRTLPAAESPAHVLACFFQIRRAFHHIHRSIVGESLPAAHLRAAAWQSIFTHDMRRYRRSLYKRMGDMTTLLIGATGTGKELVARAIGRARYIPFDPSTQKFTEDFAGTFFPINLSALSPTLIESELFGHRRGAFTGALADRAGWLERCPPLGTVFLDEIGELDPSIQVKLLRVLQTRRFQRLGETEPREFHGKVIAATNRALTEPMRRGDFRADFYYRLCSDVIRTPSLAEQIADRPEDLRDLILFIAQDIAEEDPESLADEVAKWVEAHLGPSYPWPGNIRELEQCVRNILIRREYRPPAVAAAEEDGDAEPLVRDLRNGALSADELLRQYCTLIYARTGSYERAATQLDLDRRTVKARVDNELLDRITQGNSGRPGPVSKDR